MRRRGKGRRRRRRNSEDLKRIQQSPLEGEEERITKTKIKKNRKNERENPLKKK